MYPQVELFRGKVVVNLFMAFAICSLNRQKCCSLEFQNVPSFSWVSAGHVDGPLQSSHTKEDPSGEQSSGDRFAGEGETTWC